METTLSPVRGATSTKCPMFSRDSNTSPELQRGICPWSCRPDSAAILSGHQRASARGTSRNKQQPLPSRRHCRTSHPDGAEKCTCHLAHEIPCFPSRICADRRPQALLPTEMLRLERFLKQSDRRPPIPLPPHPY